MCGCVRSFPTCVAVYEVFLHVWLCTKFSYMCGCVQSLPTCVAVYEVFLHVYEDFVHLCVAVQEVFLHCVPHHMAVSRTTWLCRKSSYMLSCTAWPTLPSLVPRPHPLLSWVGSGHETNTAGCVGS